MLGETQSEKCLIVDQMLLSNEFLSQPHRTLFLLQYSFLYVGCAYIRLTLEQYMRGGVERKSVF